MLASLSVLVMLTTFACGTSDPVAQENASDEASSDGIQVHGHWTLNVINPDGAIANTYEFENMLTVEGKYLLAHLLAGDTKIVDHQLQFYFPENDSAECAGSSKSSGFLGIAPNHDTGWIVEASIVKFAQKGQGVVSPPWLMLSGVCTVQGNGHLRHVGTYFTLDTASATHYLDSSTNFQLTSKSLGDPGVSVKNGQIIAANVELTFN